MHLKFPLRFPLKETHLIADHVRFFRFLFMTTRPIRITDLKRQLAAAILTVEHIAAHDSQVLSADNASTLVNNVSTHFFNHKLMETQRIIWTAS